AKPANQGVLLDVEDVYGVKGCTEWVDPAVTVMLMERRQRKHKEHIEIGFAKTRVAVDAVPKMNLFFDKDRCLFVPDTGQCKACKFRGDSDDDDYSSGNMTISGSRITADLSQVPSR